MILDLVIWQNYLTLTFTYWRLSGAFNYTLWSSLANGVGILLNFYVVFRSWMSSHFKIKTPQVGANWTNSNCRARPWQWKAWKKQVWLSDLCPKPQQNHSTALHWSCHSQRSSSQKTLQEVEVEDEYYWPVTQHFISILKLQCISHFILAYIHVV